MIIDGVLKKQIKQKPPKKNNKPYNAYTSNHHF